jgi:hypothetical protein
MRLELISLYCECTDLSIRVWASFTHVEAVSPTHGQRRTGINRCRCIRRSLNMDNGRSIVESPPFSHRSEMDLMNRNHEEDTWQEMESRKQISSRGFNKMTRKVCPQREARFAILVPRNSTRKWWRTRSTHSLYEIWWNGLRRQVRSRKNQLSRGDRRVDNILRHTWWWCRLYSRFVAACPLGDYELWLIYLCGTKEPYNNLKLLLDYIRCIFLRCLSNLRRRSELAGNQAVLLRDNCPPLVAQKVLDLPRQARVRVIIFAPHTTNIFQVLDLTLFGVLKRHGQYHPPFETENRTADFIVKTYKDVHCTMVGTNIWGLFRRIGLSFHDIDDTQRVDSTR